MTFNEIIEAIPVKPYYRDEQADVVIYCADCRDILPLIPDKSIDLVLTDPPYSEEAIPCYELSARESKRLLKVGRFYYTYCGAMYLPQYISGITKSLDWFWLYNLRHNGGYPRVWSARVQ